MPFSVNLIKRLEAVEPPLRGALIALLEEVERQREVSITKKEFLEFAKTTEENFQKVWKTIGELAEAQKRTEIRLNELAEAQKKTEQRLDSLTEKVEALAEAQKRTEIRVNELAEAQKRTEVEIRKLGIGLRRTREQIGGLARSVAYALENEAFRKLPAFLKERYQIEVIDNIIRAEIEGEEINILGQVKKDGQEMMLVGEAVLKLDDRRKLKLLSDKVQLVKETYGKGVIPIIITHFAKKNILERAKNAGIIIVQSFEWH